MFKISLCLALILSGAGALFAQQIQLGAMQESTSLPFNRFKEFHPGGEISYLPSPRAGNIFDRQWQFSAGYFFHREVESAFYLKTSHLWLYPVHEVFTVELSGGGGYLHSFYPGNVYTLQEGDFVAKTQYGTSAFVVGNWNWYSSVSR